MNQIISNSIDNQKLWLNALSDIELEVSRANFLTWFKNTTIAKCDREVIYVSVPNAFVRDWLFNKYHKSILRALRKNLESVRHVEYTITKDISRIDHVVARNPETHTLNQMEIQEVYINKEDNLNPRYTFDSFIVGSFNELAHAAAQAVIKNPGISYNP